MKKVLLIIFAFFCLTCGVTFAEGDLWDNYGDNNAYGQQAVTDEEFDNVVEKLKEKKFGKKKNKNIPKGESYRHSNETDFLQAVPEEMPILCIPLELQLDTEHVIPVGHYQVEGVKINEEPVIKLYQAHYLIAQIPAVETLDDFGKDTINFVDIVETGDDKVKIIFGNVDFNAYALLDSVVKY